MARVSCSLLLVLMLSWPRPQAVSTHDVLHFGILVKEFAKWGTSFVSSWVDTCRNSGTDPSIQIFFPGTGWPDRMWSPSPDESLQTFLEKQPELLDMDMSTARVVAQRDVNNRREEIKTESQWTAFLTDAISVDQRKLFLFVQPGNVADRGIIGSTLTRLSPYVARFSQKVVDNFRKFVLSKKVTVEEVETNKQALKDAVQVKELQVRGDVTQMNEVPAEKWDAVVTTLEDAGVPNRVTSVLRLASMLNGGMQKSTYDLSYKDDRLESAYSVRLVAQKTPTGALNLVVFSYEMKFVNPAVKQISFEVADKIEKHVDKAGALFWRDKMQVEALEDLF